MTTNSDSNKGVGFTPSVSYPTPYAALTKALMQQAPKKDLPLTFPYHAYLQKVASSKEPVSMQSRSVMPLKLSTLDNQDSMKALLFTEEAVLVAKETAVVEPVLTSREVPTSSKTASVGANLVAAPLVSASTTGVLHPLDTLNAAKMVCIQEGKAPITFMDHIRSNPIYKGAGFAFGTSVPKNIALLASLPGIRRATDEIVENPHASEQLTIVVASAAETGVGAPISTIRLLLQKDKEATCAREVFEKIAKGNKLKVLYAGASINFVRTWAFNAPYFPIQVALQKYITDPSDSGTKKMIKSGMSGFFAGMAASGASYPAHVVSSLMKLDTEGRSAVKLTADLVREKGARVLYTGYASVPARMGVCGLITAAVLESTNYVFTQYVANQSRQATTPSPAVKHDPENDPVFY